MDKFLDIPTKAIGYVYKAITVPYFFIASRFNKTIYIKHKCKYVPCNYFFHQMCLLTLHVRNIIIKYMVVH